MKRKQSTGQISDSESLFEWVKRAIKRKWEDDNIRYIRSQLGIPENGLLPDQEEPDHTKLSDMFLQSIAYSIGIHPDAWREVLWKYVCYGTLDVTSANQDIGLAVISTIDHELKKPRSSAKQRNEDDYYFPILIKISPYLRQRQLIHFVKQNFREKIEPLQIALLKHRPSIAYLRRKDPVIEARNQRLFELKHWEKFSNKKTVTVLQKEFPNHCDGIDEGSVGAIYSKMKKFFGLP